MTNTAHLPLHAGDIRLMNKADLVQRIGELLPSEGRHIACMGRQGAEIDRLRGRLSYIEGNFEGHRESASFALDGAPVPEAFTP